MQRRFKRTLMSLLLATGCGSSKLLVKDAPLEPFDAMVVPGCPTTQEGAPTRCLLGRAGWAALLYQRGWTKHLITTGGAVHSPYVEAEMLAKILETLGVPASAIYLDPNALHTDENMYNAWQIAKAAGFTRVAVASDPMQARWGTLMMNDYGANAVGYAMDEAALTAFLAPRDAELRALRVRKVDDFISLQEREKQREQRTGRTRPASFFLYAMLGYLKWIGKPWTPIAPATQALQTWDRQPKIEP